jgi:signal transduction histidine kinase
MQLATAQTGALIGLAAAALTVGGLLLSGPRREHKALDFAMAVGLLSWMVFLVWQVRFSPQPPGAVDEFIEHMAYQLCVAAACELALTGARLGRRFTVTAWALQIAGGGAVLLAWTGSGQDEWFRLWERLNAVVLGSFLLVLVVRWPVYRRERALPAALLSMGLLVFCVLADLWHHPTSRLGTAGMFIYPSVLFALWFLVSARRRARAAEAAVHDSGLDRQRIAQDVHDGVGSHLVSILSSLDLKNPEQRALALSLEQCLLDLKITVDSLSLDSPSLLESLAMLRYRIQPSLQRLGIALQREVEDLPALDALPPLALTHTLRIVQEAIANVMRHAGATRLRVSCRHLPEAGRIELRVVDDGRGMATPPDAEGAPAGRGLTGMRRRAEEAGLLLTLRSVPGQGTSVELGIPLLEVRAVASGAM